MNYKVIQKNNKYYAVISNYGDDIESYEVLTSWTKMINGEKKFYFDLFKNEINLIENEIDFSAFLIEIPEIKEIFNYVTIMFRNKEGAKRPLHIDYKTAHNVEMNEEVYFHKLPDGILLDDDERNYKVVIKGNKNDLHQVVLKAIRSEINEIRLGLPKKAHLISDRYELFLYLNGKQVYRNKIGVITNKKIKFNIETEDMCQYIKINLKPNFIYKTLKKLTVKHNNNIVAIHNSKSLLEKIDFFIENNGLYGEILLDIEYELKEDTLSNEIFNETFRIKKQIYNPSSYEIEEIKTKQSLSKDNLTIEWKPKKMNQNIVYRVYLNGIEVSKTKNSFCVISKMSEKNNGLTKHNVTIKSTTDTTTSSNLFISNQIDIPNYSFIESPGEFIPIIDYSECLKNKKIITKLRWSRPTWNCTFDIKIKVKNTNMFLDEFSKPWITERILDKPIVIFGEKYLNLEETLLYDFDNKGNEKYGKVNECVISPNGQMNGFINIGENNYFDLPTWFTESDSDVYEITIKVKDKWGKNRGESTCNFSIPRDSNRIFTEDSLRFNRNQFMQFGESGTVGEFYKKEKPSPADSLLAYSKRFKTFEGKPLYDLTNTDKNSTSLYYYFSASGDKNVELSYKRIFNFNKLKYKIVYGKEEIIPLTTHIPKGNKFLDNIVEIERSKFKKEGEYTLEITTENFAGIDNEIKEFKFYVFNENPEAPLVKVKEEDCNIEKGKMKINKKYFQIDILNNIESKKYAGWAFKEVHFFFRKEGEVYKDYPDFVAKTNKEEGAIFLKNKTPIENGDYNYKAVAYDYNGNKSESKEFPFSLRSEMKITPQSIYLNEIPNKFNWVIEKAQDSEGFIYELLYSSDGVRENFKMVKHGKIISPYYVDNSDTKKTFDFNLNFPNEKRGFYKLKVYEFNTKHSVGIPEYFFESEIIEISENFNISLPIYAKNIEGKVAVFNRKQFNEWSYTSNLEDVIFKTIHNETVFDDKETTRKIEGQRYKIRLTSPGNERIYEKDLPLAVETGLYMIRNLSTLCDIKTQTEGIWKIDFITIDKYGNNNSEKGYYRYEILVVNRKPVIDNVTTLSENPYNTFGIESDKIGFFIENENSYKNIIGYSEYKDKFKVEKFEVVFIESPNRKKIKLELNKNDNRSIIIMDPLSDKEKTSNSKDGYYNTSICCYDPLGRSSELVLQSFRIDTSIDSEIIYTGNKTFNSKDVTIKALIKGEVEKVYYKFSNEISSELISFDKSWRESIPQMIESNNGSFLGVQFIGKKFETDGVKELFYVIEEKSGNKSKIKKYNFKVDTTVINRVFFDYYNKTLYTNLDEEIKISWNETSKDVQDFSYMIEKVKLNNKGEFEVIENLTKLTFDETLEVIVGSLDNPMLRVGDKREIIIPCSENTFITSGIYRVKVIGTSIYGEVDENTFVFQYDDETLEIPKVEAESNKITITSNTVSWSYIKTAAFYEFSYDSKNWIKTYSNRIGINRNNLIKNNNEEYFVYIRWVSRTGIKSSITEIKLYINIEPVEIPIVEFYDSNKTITEDNKNLKWNILIKKPEKIYGIYYSFDKITWFLKKVNSTLTVLTNEYIEYPLKDGYYDVFVKAVEDNPIENTETSSSEIVHKSIRIFAEPIEKVQINLESGKTYEDNEKIFLLNKTRDVTYFIYINGRLVKEGYEISSSTLKCFNIIIKAKKNNLENVYTLYGENDNYHIWSFVTSEYIIDISNSKLVCTLNEKNKTMTVKSMNALRTKQVILYREKLTKEWNILRKDDTLTLLKEWEFHITTINMI